MSDLTVLRKKVQNATYRFTNRNISEPCTARDLEEATSKLVKAMLAIVDEIEAMQRE